MEEETYPIVGLSAEGIHIEAMGTVNPKNLAEKLIPIRDAFINLFEKDPAQPGFGLESLELALTISAEGGVAFIAKGTAEASLTLTFSRPEKVTKS